MKKSADWHSDGAPYPHGCTYLPEHDAYNWALSSRHATHVELRLYGDDPSRPLQRHVLHPIRNRTGRVWHLRLPRATVEGVRSYGYCVDGPDEPGNAFDPDKVLLDPQARGIVFPPDFSRVAASTPGSNEGRAPLALLPRPRPAFDWTGDRRPRHTHDLIIYEMHVGGFTRRPNAGVPLERRGTFLGVIDMIPHLKNLGVTAVELLPVYQFDDVQDDHIPRNYWGYMPLSFFVPHAGYGVSPHPEDLADEFRTMVLALHKADIEVILDVVYNHSTEQGEGGPTYNLRGVDNGTYYLMSPDLTRYLDETGTGNTLRPNHPATRKLISDSLRYWVQEMHVDGFRFDLASIFTRNDDGSINSVNPPIIDEISSDPVFADVRLIAEAWDINCYQLGKGFPGQLWMQWNGEFRDELRDFVKSEPGQVPLVMRRLYGSDDLFPEGLPDSYRPFQSINFITCHDGFCLRDLVSYNEKRNWENGLKNTDGSNHNRSWNCGHEGDDGAPPVVWQLRKRQIRNFFALLMVANGTPMFCAGDEMMMTQGGNNNPFNQDNETTWLDWDLLNENADLFRFFQKLIALRKSNPSLGRNHYWQDDVRWYGSEAGPDLAHHSHSLAFFLSGRSVGGTDLYVIANAYWKELTFRIQEPGPWRRLVDTSLPSPEDAHDLGEGPRIHGDTYAVHARSVVILERG